MKGIRIGSVLLGIVVFLIGLFGRQKKWAATVDLGGMDLSDLE